MAGFVQIIEFTTSRIDEIEKLAESMDDMGFARRATITADRDRSGTYLNIVEFDSYDEAMQNSSRPEVGEFAGKLAELCDGPPRFYNLDVVTSM
jgi:hypothetical protein